MNKLFLFIGILFSTFLTAQTDTVRFETISKTSVKIVACDINDVPLSFNFDTVVSVLCLSKKQANLIESQGIKLFYTGKTSKYTLSGRDALQGISAEGRDIILKKIKIGKTIFNDIRATVLQRDSSAGLFGKNLFKFFLIDNVKQRIVFLPKTALDEAIDNSVVSDDSKDSTLTTAQYFSLGVPPMIRPWDEGDFKVALTVLEKLAEKSPEKLPKPGSKRSGMLYKKLVNQKELITALRGYFSGSEIKTDKLSELLLNTSRLQDLYFEKQKYNDLIPILSLQWDVREEFIDLMKAKQKDESTGLISEDTLNIIKSNFRNLLNMPFYLSLDSIQKRFDDKDLENFILKCAYTTPKFVKFVNENDCKVSLRERYMYLAGFAYHQAVRDSLLDVVDLLSPKNESKASSRLRVDVKKKIEQYPYFVKACIALEGKFALNKDGSLSYKLVTAKGKPVIIMEGATMYGKLNDDEGNAKSVTYPTYGLSPESFLKNINLILAELYR